MGIDPPVRSLAGRLERRPAERPRIFGYKNWFDEFQNEAAKGGDSEIDREEDVVVSNRSCNQLEPIGTICNPPGSR